MDPAQWLADYRDRLEQAAYGAQQARDSLQGIEVGANSPRGEVTVKVNAGGVLSSVQLTPMARRLEAETLGALIVETAREAQREASALMAEVMSGYLGDNAALAQVTQHMPAEAVR